jgi:hypothetical protein
MAFRRMTEVGAVRRAEGIGVGRGSPGSVSAEAAGGIVEAGQS